MSNRTEAGTRHTGIRLEAGTADAEPVKRTEPPSAASPKQKHEGRIFPGRFSGRTAVITGGASGLGNAVAKLVVASGGRVLSSEHIDLDAGE